MIEQSKLNFDETEVDNIENKQPPAITTSMITENTNEPISAIEKFKANQKLSLSDIKSQADAVLYHLQEEGSITTFEGFKEWGITRMGAVIHTLRHKHKIIIESEDIETENRFKHTVVYSKYKLKKDQSAI